MMKEESRLKLGPKEELVKSEESALITEINYLNETGEKTQKEKKEV